MKNKGKILLVARLVWIAFVFLFLNCTVEAKNRSDPLPSWNNTITKKAILEFVQTTTDPKSPLFLPREQRIVTFDQDGTTWVEHPVYTQVNFSFDRIIDLASNHPEWKNIEPFKSIIAGDKQAMAQFSLQELEKILFVTHAGVSVEEYRIIVQDWLRKARHPRWNRPYSELVYQPMLELMHYLRANGFKTYIVTGGGQDFVRTYAEAVYGIPPEQIIGSALETQFSFDKTGKPVLIKIPKLVLNNNFSGKPEDIELMIGRRPSMAIGNSTGDQEMLEYTQNGNHKQLMMLVFHDDAEREYAYGPAQGLPDTKVGTFPQTLYDEAIKQGWFIISIKKDWNTIFPFEK